MRTLLPFGLFALAVLTPSAALSQSAKDLNLTTGKEIWDATCAGCHGVDGKGQPVTTLGFEPPASFPDFTDCNGSTRESGQQWNAVIHDGGRARAFTEIMPSFGPPMNPALTDDEIWKVIKYVRTFCEEDSKWPRGDFNFPRPMFTDKAFPEDETVLTTAVNVTGPSGLGSDLNVEKRFGAANNLAFHFRTGFNQLPSGSWAGGLGDIGIEWKRVLLMSNKTGTILSGAGGISLPTGDPKRGLGGGITTLEGFLAAGQILPSQSFIQQQVGIEGPPFRRHDTLSEVYSRTAIGKTFAQERGFGRAWTPMIEMVATRGLGPGERWGIDTIPQMQVTLSKRQHIRFSAGVSIPSTNIGDRQKQFVFYLLWDRFDGSLKEGWR